MGYNLLDEGTEVNGDVSVDEELSKNSGKIEENNSLNVYDESYNNYDIIANNENDLGDKKSDDLQSDIDVNMRKNDEIGEGFDGVLGGDLDDDGDDLDDEELDENDPDYDWEHINFLKELKKSLDAIDERDAKELEERHKNGGLLDSQLVNYDDYEYEDFSEYDHLSNEEIDKMCGDMSDLDWDAIEEFWKTHKRGAPHILIDPVTREEIGTIYDTPSEEEEEEEEVDEVENMIVLKGVRRVLPNTNLGEDIEFMKILENFEDNINYPYFDSVNILTIGAGLNIKDNFYNLPWRDLAGNMITDKKILDREKNKLDKIYYEQEKIKKIYPKREWAKHMRKATSFKDETILRLSTDYLLEEKKYRIKLMEAELQVNIDNYNKKRKRANRKILDLDKMPREYAKVLLELKYNLGGGKFNENKFPKLFSGLLKGDKKVILENIRRIENNENDRKRNIWAKKTLEKVDDMPSIERY